MCICGNPLSRMILRFEDRSREIELGHHRRVPSREMKTAECLVMDTFTSLHQARTLLLTKVGHFLFDERQKQESNDIWRDLRFNIRKIMRINDVAAKLKCPDPAKFKCPSLRDF